MASQIIVLPAATSLTGLWAELGFEPRSDGHGYEVTGISRRLAAGIRSIQQRGTAAGTGPYDWSRARDQLVIDPVERPGGWHALSWQSHGGAWSYRTWRVTARIRLTPTGVELRRTRVAVGSATSEEVTIWRGAILDKVVAARVAGVLEVAGARVSEPSDSLAGEELEMYHDLHSSPVKAWDEDPGRVVLWDNAWGEACLVTQGGECPEAMHAFLEAGWNACLKKS